MGLAAGKSARKTILVVDDDPDEVNLIVEVFREGKITNRVQIVNDGEEAITYLGGTGKYARREKYPFPALMLLDLKMPKKSGLDVLQYLRTQPNAKALGVIVLTGLQNLREVQTAYQLGAHSFLLKPLALQNLINLITALKGFCMRQQEGGYELDFTKPS